jgi:hypothetical protein
MSGYYDTDIELSMAIQEAISALLNVPIVGTTYDQQHSDSHMRAYVRLKDAYEASELFEEN